MITTINLINKSITSHTYHFFPFSFFVVRTLKSYPSSKFQVYDTVLLTEVTMLYITSLELTLHN